MSNIQYIDFAKKGDTVTYGNHYYRIQDDGRGWLHIVIFENGKRKKISIDKVLLFGYGTEQDYIFNGWWQIYPDYQIFKSFAEHEKKCLDITQARTQ